MVSLVFRVTFMVRFWGLELRFSIVVSSSMRRLGHKNLSSGRHVEPAGSELWVGSRGCSRLSVSAVPPPQWG